MYLYVPPIENREQQLFLYLFSLPPQIFLSAHCNMVNPILEDKPCFGNLLPCKWYSVSPESDHVSHIILTVKN